ncbi:excisionase [Undibacterium sp. 5I1]|uniref:excisionase n=1 Tax=unclassified Undibacterium TaxID=2630295 RepID=UPI002AB3FD45|nr:MULTISPECIES: excisionase [unclassified Undibacterium]MDY7538755.1 excisionase [Undibacterium sp. 5I1]MEB0229694.1 excisionase [Undibacterium sp. 10I3]MEB0258441.1 excisionase [Undibacterium sp. 5I1]
MQVMTPNWVLINKFCELKGYSEDAVRAKIKRREWEKEVLWRKAPDNRIVINVTAVNLWMGGSHV